MNLGKHFVFICLFLGLLGCGRKSVVKTDIIPKTIAETNPYTEPAGDEEEEEDITLNRDKDLLRSSFPILITTDPKASPLPNLGLLFGGIAKIIANTLAALGAGRTEMYFHQPTPELPPQIKEVRLKRVFFYIEPKANESRRSHWFSKIFRGKGDVDFNFIKKLVLSVKPEVPDQRLICLVPNQTRYEPLFPCNDPVLTTEKTEKYLSVFREKAPKEEPDLTDLQEFVLVKYNGNQKAKYVKNKKRGAMYMVRTGRPGETNHFLRNRPGYHDLIENMVTLDNVILVELRKDNVVKEAFENQLSADATYLDSTLGVEQIEECNDSICLDVKVEEANLLPFLKRFNSNRINAFIDASKVPETFQLKGFLEVELGAKLGF